MQNEGVGLKDENVQNVIFEEKSRGLEKGRGVEIYV